jgi:plasmid stabilization system protein ParE
MNVNLTEDIGRHRPELRTSLRSWIVYPFVAFSSVNDGARLVTIERVLHGHMDIGEENFD